MDDDPSNFNGQCDLVRRAGPWTCCSEGDAIHSEGGSLHEWVPVAEMWRVRIPVLARRAGCACGPDMSVNTRQTDSHSSLFTHDSRHTTFLMLFDFVYPKVPAPRMSHLHRSGHLQQHGRCLSVSFQPTPTLTGPPAHDKTLSDPRRIALLMCVIAHSTPTRACALQYRAMLGRDTARLVWRLRRTDRETCRGKGGSVQRQPRGVRAPEDRQQTAMRSKIGGYPPLLYGKQPALAPLDVREADANANHHQELQTQGRVT